MKFHLDSNGILKSATLLALRLNASAVQIDHLLMCDLGGVEPVEVRDIPFSAEVLALLDGAAELAHRENSTIVRPRHLQLLLIARTGLSPEWGFQRQRLRMSDLVDRSLTHLLEYKGVNVEHLHRALHGLTVRECRPGPDFIASPAGRRFAGIALKMATKKDAALILLLLSYLLCEGPAARPFLKSGLSEELLVGLMEEHPEELRQPRTFSFDFSQLVMEQSRLGDDVQQTLEIAWILREGAELRGTDLLRGLVATSNPMEEYNVDILLRQISGDDFSTVLATTRAAEPRARVKLSPEIHRIMDCALREAGPVAVVNNFHLLIGLAECGNRLLTDRGVTAEKIRGHLG